MSELLLRTERLLRIYRKGPEEIRALSDVSFEVSGGEMVIVRGPSGAGKSTLLEVAGGLLSPTSGRVLYEGEDIYRMTEKRLSRLRMRKIGFVFQFYHLLPELNVLENVALPALMAGRGWLGAKKAARALLEEVGLSGRVKHRPAEISGGEAQRVAIARALMNSPRLLLCDEPTGNLDSRSGAQVWRLIERLSEERGMSVVAVSHNASDAEMFDTVYEMSDGALRKA